MQQVMKAAFATATRRAVQAASRSFFTQPQLTRSLRATIKVPVSVRYNSDSIRGQVVPLDECVQINQKTLQDLRNLEVPLSNMKVTAAPVAVRWNQLMLALMLTRLNAIKNLNPSFRDEDAYVYLQKLSISSRKHLNSGETALKQVDRDIWEFLLRVAFGRGLPEEMPLTEVRKLSLALCNAVSEDEFQTKLRDACHGKTTQQKNEVLVTMLMEAQLGMFQKFGYTGEDGYICVQKNLVDFAGDTVVLAYTSAYNTILLEVAEIDPAATPLPKMG